MSCTVSFRMALMEEREEEGSGWAVCVCAVPSILAAACSVDVCSFMSTLSTMRVCFSNVICVSLMLFLALCSVSSNGSVGEWGGGDILLDWLDWLLSFEENTEKNDVAALPPLPFPLPPVPRALPYCCRGAVSCCRMLLLMCSVSLRLSSTTALMPLILFS